MLSPSSRTAEPPAAPSTVDARSARLDGSTGDRRIPPSAIVGDFSIGGGRTSEPNAPPERAPQSRESAKASSQLATRLSAAAIPPDQVQKLHARRHELLDKKFAGTLTTVEEKDLAYVRWQLDRIEDAKNGWVLDALGQQIERYEEVLARISAIEQQFTARAAPRKRR